MEFDAVLQANGKTATGIAVPPKVVEQLGGGKRALVTVTINGHSYASAIGSMDGKAMLPVSAEHRQKAGIVAGDRVTVVIALDTAPRVVDVPADLTKALRRNAGAERAFAALSNSAKKRHVVSIEGAKTAETRERRITKTIAELTE